MVWYYYPVNKISAFTIKLDSCTCTMALFCYGGVYMKCVVHRNNIYFQHVSGLFTKFCILFAGMELLVTLTWSSPSPPPLPGTNMRQFGLCIKVRSSILLSFLYLYINCAVSDVILFTFLTSPFSDKCPAEFFANLLNHAISITREC